MNKPRRREELTGGGQVTGGQVRRAGNTGAKTDEPTKSEEKNSITKKQTGLTRGGEGGAGGGGETGSDHQDDVRQVWR